MATIRRVSKAERDAERRSTFRIVCTGFSKEEFGSTHRFIKKEFGCRTLLRNPFPPQFDAKAVHEIIAQIAGSAIGGYALKKAVDAAQELLVAYMKYKFMTAPKDGQTREIELYAPDGSVHKFKHKPKNSGKRKG